MTWIQVMLNIIPWKNSRDDLTTDTHRLTDSVGELVRSRANDLPKHLIGIASVVSNRLGRLGHIVVPRNEVGLAVVAGLDRRQGLPVFLDELAEPIHHLASVDARQISPTGVIQCCPRSSDSGVDIFSRGRVNGCDFFRGSIKRELMQSTLRIDHLGHKV